MWTFNNDMASNLFTKDINKRMCMRYKHVVEKLLWIVEAKRVDLTNEVSIEQTTKKVSEFLVLWEDGSTERIPLKDVKLSAADVSKFLIKLNTKNRYEYNNKSQI